MAETPEMAKKVNTEQKFDTQLIEQLAALFKTTDLTEIEVQNGEIKIRVARTPAAQTVHMVQGGGYAPAPAASAPAAAAPAPSGEAPTKPKTSDKALISPMVGTAYRSSAPDKPPFVEVGTQVKQGQVVLVIEAMKTFNEIPAPRAGTITAIFVDSGQPVEYGEPLLVIE